MCASGMNPAGTAALGCSAVTRACAVPCTDDSQCRGAGLVGFVCDTRPLREVDSSLDSDEPYNFCANPTCG